MSCLLSSPDRSSWRLRHQHPLNGDREREGRRVAEGERERGRDRERERLGEKKRARESGRSGEPHIAALLAASSSLGRHL